MTFDRSQAQALAKKRGEEKARPDLPEYWRQAAVSSENLTDAPHWDLFLSFIQAGVEDAEKIRGQYAETLLGSNVVNHEEMLLAKIGLAECDATIRAFKVVIKLPADMKENGDRAKSIIERTQDAAV